MKKLFIMRHGKAEKMLSEEDDYIRNLTDIGAERTRKVANFLYLQGVMPDVIVSSTAHRAYQTAKILVEVFGDIRIYENMDVYDGDLDTMVDIIKQTSDMFDTIFLVGHNPDLTNLIYKLAQLDGLVKLQELHTSGVAAFTFTVDRWVDIMNSDETTLNYILDPKMLNVDDCEDYNDMVRLMKREKTFKIKKTMVNVKQFIEHLKTFDENLPVVFNTMEIGPVGMTLDMARTEEIDFLDDDNCEPFNSLLLG